MRIVNFRGKYCIYWRENGIPKRISLRTNNLDVAKRRFRDYQVQLNRPRETVEDIFEAYLEEHPNEKFAWKALKSFWASYRPDQVTKDACKEYIKSRDVKPGTVHRELTMLRAALRWHDPKTPAIFFFPPRPAPREHRLTKAECAKLIKNAGRPHVKLFIILALTTAARTSALLELTWDRVDFDKGIIRLAKGGESRLKGRATVPINETARKALEEAYKARLSDYVIEYGGGPLKSIRKGVVEAGKRAKLKVSPHVLRHSAATIMAEDGVPMEEIAQFLGHSSPHITYKVYARYSPNYLQKAAESLEFLYDPDD